MAPVPASFEEATGSARRQIEETCLVDERAGETSGWVVTIVVGSGRRMTLHERFAERSWWPTELSVLQLIKGIVRLRTEPCPVGALSVRSQSLRQWSVDGVWA